MARHDERRLWVTTVPLIPVCFRPSWLQTLKLRR